MNIPDRVYIIVAEYIYLVTNVTNQNYMHEDANNWLKSKYVCYHLVQTDMYFSFYLEVQRLKYIKKQYCMSHTVAKLGHSP
jgi:hypothetical protein